MKDRPTYKDYKQSHTEGNVIMTPDGSLYAILNMWLYKLFKFFSNVLLGAVGFISAIMVLFNGMWPNLIFDFYFAAFVLSHFLTYPKYILLRFIRLEPGNLDHKEASSWFPPQQEKRQTSSKIFDIAGKVILACMAVFILLNSHTAQFVRSLFDSPRLVSARILQNGSIEILDESSSTSPVITIPSNLSNEFDVQFVMAYTAETAEFALDGKPVTDDFSMGDKDISLFWQPDYLKRRYDLNLTKVHDGSTLTLTCGDITREWVFEVPDEEAS